MAAHAEARQLNTIPTDEDLVALLETLRADGFAIGLEEHLAAQQLIIDLEDELKNAGAERLRTLLAPLLACDPEQQATFYARFEQWLAAIGREADTSAPLKHGKLGQHEELDRLARRTHPAFWVLLGAVIVVAFAWTAREFMPSQKTDDGEEDAQQTEEAIGGEEERGFERKLTEKLLPIVTIPPTTTTPERVAGVVHGGNGDPVSGAEIEVESWTFEALPISAAEASSPYAAGLMPDGSWIALQAEQDGLATLILLRPAHERVQRMPIGERRVDAFRTVMPHPAGDRFAVGFRSGEVLIVDMESLKTLETLRAPGAVQAVAFAPDSDRFLVVSETNEGESNLRVWSLETRSSYDVPLPGGIDTAHYMDEGRIFAQGDQVWIWADDGRGEVKALPGRPILGDRGIFLPPIAPDGTRLALWSQDSRSEVVLVSVQGDGEPTVLRHEEDVSHVVFSPDGQAVLTLGDSGRVYRWSVGGGESPQRQYGPVETLRLTWLSLSATGRFLLNDDKLSLWDMSGFASPLEFPPARTEWVTLLGDDLMVVFRRETGGGSEILLAKRSTAEVSTGTDGRFEIDPIPSGSAAGVRVSHEDYLSSAWTPLNSGEHLRTINLATAPAEARVMDALYENLNWLSPLVVALPLFVLLLWLFWRARRARLVLEHRRTHETPELTRIGLEAPSHGLFGGAGFTRARIAARRRESVETTDLDDDKTVDATVHEAGRFTPVYRTSPQLPGYVALIDRASFRDQQARMVDEFLDHLEAGDVDIVRYYFDHDPRLCDPSGGDGTHIGLRELTTRHALDRLLVFSDGSGLVDPVTGRPADWLSVLSAWPARALLTPVPVWEWTAEELGLAASGLRVYPASTDGLRVFAEALQTPEAAKTPAPEWAPPYPELLHERPMRWVDGGEPTAAEFQELRHQLRLYLSVDGFRWLCALAVYPELAWHLTLFFGVNLRDDAGKVLITEERLWLLTRLPWLRHNHMPDWLRVELIAALSNEDEQQIRVLLQELMLTALEHPGGGFVLEVARAQPDSIRKSWRRLLGDFLRAEPRGSALRDYVFVEFLMGQRPRQLQFVVPRLLRRLLYFDGVRGFGLRPALLASLAVLASTTGYAASHFVEQLYRDRPLVAQSTVSELWDETSPRLVLRENLGRPVIGATWCAGRAAFANPSGTTFLDPSKGPNSLVDPIGSKPTQNPLYVPFRIEVRFDSPREDYCLGSLRSGASVIRFATLFSAAGNSVVVTDIENGTVQPFVGDIEFGQTMILPGGGIAHVLTDQVLVKFLVSLEPPMALADLNFLDSGSIVEGVTSSRDGRFLLIYGEQLQPLIGGDERRFGSLVFDLARGESPIAAIDVERIVTTALALGEGESAAEIETTNGNQTGNATDLSAILTIDLDGMATLWPWLIDPSTQSADADPLTLTVDEARLSFQTQPGTRTAIFSDDGSRIATAGSTELVELWDSFSGVLVAHLYVPGGVQDLAFSPDSQLLMTRSTQGVWLWDTLSGGLLTTISMGTEEVSGAAFSEDGQQLVTASAEGIVMVWRLGDAEAAAPEQQEAGSALEEQETRGASEEQETTSATEQQESPAPAGRQIAGVEYFEVDFTNRETATSVCARLGRQAGEFTSRPEVCAAFNPRARSITSGSGDRGVAYCSGKEQGACRSNPNTCLSCPSCTVGLGPDEDGSRLYSKMYTTCIDEAEAGAGGVPGARVDSAQEAMPDTTEPSETSRADSETAQSVDFGNFYALAIGNSDYADSALDMNTPVDEARGLARVVEERYGFRTRVLINNNRSEILEELNRIVDDLKEDDNLLVFYSGQTRVVDSIGYWLPADARENEPSSWIADRELGKYLQGMRTRSVLVVSESLFPGAVASRAGLSRLIPQTPQWVRVLNDRSSRTILTADPGSPFADGVVTVLAGNERVLPGHLLTQQLNNPNAIDANQTYGSPKVIWPLTVSEANVRYLAIPGFEDTGGDFLFVPQPPQAAAE